ncbi:MAG: phage portal protein [Chloroflexi bacterium]|nr:MAG: phage portal protein [Chloroflexota bacterium]
MKIYSPLLRLFGLGGLSNPDKGFQYSSTIGTATQSGINVSDEQALRVSAVWSCVHLIAQSVANLPLNVYELTPTGRRQITERDPLVDLLKLSPNRFMKPRDFRLHMTTQLALWNNAYAVIEWSGERPVSITPLRPNRMVPYINDDNDIEYHYSTSGGVVVYSKKSILHLKGVGSDGIVGFDRLSFARESLGLAVSAEVFAAKQFANGGNGGGGFLMFDQFLTDKQRKAAHEMYSGMNETAYNANQLWILEGGVKYEPSKLPPDTMQMVETRKMQIGEIARFFGVPEVLLGTSSGASSWPASFEQQVLSFLTFTLQSYLDEWESALLDSLVPAGRKNRIVFDHDTTGFIRTDSQAKAAYLSTLVQNGLVSRNEGRRLLNLPEVPGGDELTVQVNMTELDKLSTVGDDAQ